MKKTNFLIISAFIFGILAGSTVWAAVGHYYFNPNVSYGIKLRQTLDSLKNGKQDLIDIVNIMDQMKDGSDFTYLAAKFGFTTTADAEGAYNELLSVKSKLTTDSSVTNVDAAMTQLFSKLG